MAKIEQQLIDKVASLVKQRGSKKAVADSLDISPQYLTDILHGRRPISDNIAKKLGFRWKLEEVRQ
jgi:plasmid maintenance system antidote protein VapI